MLTSQMYKQNKSMGYFLTCIFFICNITNDFLQDMEQYSETANTFLNIFLHLKILTYNNFLSIPMRKKECRISDLKEFVEHSRMHFLYFCRNCRGISKYFLLKFYPKRKNYLRRMQRMGNYSVKLSRLWRKWLFRWKNWIFEAGNQRNCLNRWRYKRSLRFSKKNTKILQLLFCFTLFINIFFLYKDKIFFK